MTRAILISLISLFSSMSFAQKGDHFNLNITNGLPTNHVYSTIVDRHGYLWIATDNGVIRYNGYALKSFTIEDGLPVNDVWQLIEDAKGRIWLGSITSKMGYIYNEKYHNAIFSTPSSHTIYPTFFKLNNGHINFFSNARSDNYHESYFKECNDTLFDYVLTDKLRKFFPEMLVKGRDFQTIIPVANEDGKTVIIYEGKFCHFALKNDKIEITKMVQSGRTDLNHHIGVNNFIFIDNFLVVFFYDYKSHIDIYNMFLGSKEQISLKDVGINEPILSAYHNNSCSYPDKSMYLITKNYVIQYELNQKIKYIRTYSIKNEWGEKHQTGENITSFIPNTLWGYCLTSTNDGLTVKSNVDEHFIKYDSINLSSYQYLGGDNDFGFWVNKSNAICIIDKHLNIKKTNLVDKQETFYSTLKKNDSEYYLLGKTTYIINVNKLSTKKLPEQALGVSIFKMIQNSPQQNYCINTIGLYTINPDSGIATKNYLESDRFRDMIYDSLRETYWAYNYNKITTITNEKIHTFGQEQFSRFGVERAEKIVIDNSFGNIFFKGNDRITMYDQENNTYKNLFHTINLKESTIDIHENKLIVYGRFGFAFCRISGKNKLSGPVYYRNIKNAKYNFIYSVQFAQNRMIINTDKGLYIAHTPVEFGISEEQYNDKYKVNYYYNKQIKDLKGGDTICLDQTDYAIRLDIINPYGNGIVKYEVTAGSNTYPLNANEYNVPIRLQKPDDYYKIKLLAYDNVWRSDPINIMIYVKPYWWQTKNMKILIWITASLLVIAIFAGSILITRRLVLNASKKRNMRMEMELKAIYSQINPHFIFNSLNSALLLVSKNRMDEAYTHISKFSKLLRSYIKSSRNKFITAEEEIINLQNYIELQQIRFKDRFSYVINTDTLTNRAVKIPSLLLQPFVENAIEHGLLNRKEKGHLSIIFDMTDNNTLVCTIEDNGIGREESKKISGLNLSKEESYGNLLVKDLVNIFNKYESVNVDITYIDKALPLTGTTVTITIKYPD